VPVRRSLSQAVMLQAAAKPADLDPVHWIGDRDETCIPVEGVKSYGAGLDPVGMPGKSFPYDELEKAPLPVAVDDFSTGADTLERIFNELGRDRFVGIE
jgi:hypothetical protein